MLIHTAAQEAFRRIRRARQLPCCGRDRRRFGTEGFVMATTHHMHLEFRHATVPTYIVSYLFPALLFAYELMRVGQWIRDHGMHFAGFKGMGYEYLLMLMFVGLQIAIEAAFLAGAAMRKDRDFEHRIPNVLAGIGCSIAILVVDLAVQLAF
jgi:hypothetical protein